MLQCPVASPHLHLPQISFDDGIFDRDLLSKNSPFKWRLGEDEDEDEDEEADDGKKARKCRHFTEEEDRQLLTMRAEGEMWSTIGRALGRGRNTIHQRHQLLSAREEEEEEKEEKEEEEEEEETAHMKRTFSEEEDRYLLAMRAVGEGWATIGRELDRNPSSLHGRHRMLCAREEEEEEEEDDDADDDDGDDDRDNEEPAAPHYMYTTRTLHVHVHYMYTTYTLHVVYM